MRDVNDFNYVRFRDGEIVAEDAEPIRFWNCNVCGAQNSELDGECQFCECGGKDCKRNNCSGPNHPDL